MNYPGLIAKRDRDAENRLLPITQRKSQKHEHDRTSSLNKTQGIRLNLAAFEEETTVIGGFKSGWKA